MPKFEKNAQGERQRLFASGPDGEPIPLFEEKNKFLNAQNLIQLAKDTSFIAIMAVGATDLWTLRRRPTRLAMTEP